MLARGIAVKNSNTLTTSLSSCSIIMRKMSTIESDVVFQTKNDKGVIILNRPKALNAITLNMVREIYSKLLLWQKDKSFVIIKGSGEKAFCAGGDVISVTNLCKKNVKEGVNFFRKEYMLNYLTGSMGIPYIALIDGITMGGGVGLSVHGQFRVATERTVFAMPETGIGIFPDVGGSYFLPRLSGHLGMFFGLSGHRLKGADVWWSGVATHMCDSALIMDLESSLLQLKNPSIDCVRNTLNQFQEKSTFHQGSKFSLEPLLPQIEKSFSGESVEDIFSRLRQDGSEWSSKLLSTMEKMSPMAMKVTHQIIKEGAQLNLADCLRMEMRVISRICEGTDFFEGVRALLVDRDNSPKWNPSVLSDITNEDVSKYFSSLSDGDELKL